MLFRSFNNEKDMVLDVKWHPTPMGRVNPFYRDYIERGSWGVAKPDDVHDKLKKNSTVFNNLDKRFPFIVILQAGWAHILNARILEQEARSGSMKFEIIRLKSGEWQLIIKCGDYSSNKALVASHKMDPSLWRPTCKESRFLNMDKWMVGQAP